MFPVKCIHHFLFISLDHALHHSHRSSYSRRRSICPMFRKRLWMFRKQLWTTGYCSPCAEQQQRMLVQSVLRKQMCPEMQLLPQQLRILFLLQQQQWETFSSSFHRTQSHFRLLLLRIPLPSPCHRICRRGEGLKCQLENRKHPFQLFCTSCQTQWNILLICSKVSNLQTLFILNSKQSFLSVDRSAAWEVWNEQWRWGWLTDLLVTVQQDLCTGTVRITIWKMIMGEEIVTENELVEVVEV